ncbi:MAG: gamma-D-glutamyl-meso-diaminopimelate peptidase [Ruminococcaceae bacterium]|nr:gamma-D-glutamyl-meso-diaminopimelate peptidase [Oscillospiraceae bacterium]
MERIIKEKDYTYSNMQKAIRGLKEEYSFMEIFSIGQSCMGREITAVKIGGGNEFTLYAGAFHGSESLTTTILLMFMEELCYSYNKGLSLCGIDVKRAFDKKGIIIVPRVNPDGCEISLCGAASAGAYAKEIKRISNGDTVHWNANLRGVDINHNFAADWQNLRNAERKAGIYGPAKTRYGGPYPESEPETAALVNLCLNTKISHAVAFHSQGEVIYWNFGDKILKRSKKMVDIMCQLSGYTADEPTGLALGGGFKDWFIETFERPAFTVELGLGENPLDEKMAREIYKDVEKMMVVTPLF